MFRFSTFRYAGSPRAAKTALAKVHPRIESLESRRLFSHVAFQVVRSGGNETAWVSRSKRHAPVTVNTETIMAAATSAAVNVLTVYGTTGNDTVTITDSYIIVNSQVLNFGSATEIAYVDNGGNDSITANASQTPVFIYVGGASSDTINTKNGSVYLLYTS